MAFSLPLLFLQGHQLLDLGPTIIYDDFFSRSLMNYIYKILFTDKGTHIAGGIEDLNVSLRRILF